MKKMNSQIDIFLSGFCKTVFLTLVLTLAFLFSSTKAGHAAADIYNCRNATTSNYSCIAVTGTCTSSDPGCNVGTAPPSFTTGLGSSTGSYNPADSDTTFSSCYFFGLQDTGSNAFFQCAQYNSFPPSAAACNTDIINGCTQGTLVDTADSGTNYQWNCRSTNGSATASCSKSKSETSWSSLGCGTTTTNYNGTCPAAAVPTAANCPAGQHIEIRDVFDCTAAPGNNLSRRETRCVADAAGCGTIATPLCGYANAQTYATAPHSADALCASGAPSLVAGPALGPWSWTCATGSSTSCLSTTCANACSPPAVDGVCDTVTPHICSSGTLGSTADTGTDYVWNCQGSYGGANNSCSIPKPIAGVCGTTTEHTCTSPAAATNFADTFTDYVWDCPGSYSGTPANGCTKPKPSIAACPSGWGPVPVNSTFDGPDAAGAQTWAYGQGYCDSETTRLPGTMPNDRCAVAVGLQAFIRTCRVDGECGTTENTCASPAAATNITNDGTNYIWDCEGRGPGHTDSSGQPHCTKPMPAPPTCGATVGTNTGDCNDQLTVFSCPSGERLVITGSPVTYCAQLTGNYETNSRYNTSQLSCVTDAACDPVVNGSCNNSVNNGCTAGSLNDITDTGTDYKWECLGSGTGHTDATNCSMPIPVVVNGSCNNSVNNGCTAGSLNDITDTGTDYKWECLGSGTGHTDATNCSMPIPSVVCAVNNATPNEQISSSSSFSFGGCAAYGSVLCPGLNGVYPKYGRSSITIRSNTSGDHLLTVNSPTMTNGIDQSVYQDFLIDGTSYRLTTTEFSNNNGIIGALSIALPVCSGATPVNGVCDNSTVNGCQSGTGTAIDISSDASYDYWKCSGVPSGNPSSQCQKAKTVSNLRVQATAVGYCTGSAVTVTRGLRMPNLTTSVEATSLSELRESNGAPERAAICWERYNAGSCIMGDGCVYNYKGFSGYAVDPSTRKFDCDVSDPWFCSYVP